MNEPAKAAAPADAAPGSAQDMPIPALLIVCATRVGQAQFFEVTPLGRSLRRLAYDPRVEVRVETDNRRGLPLVYNRQISNENRGKILLFAHDDIWLDDCFVYERLREALRVFDVIGVAGNMRRLPRQPG